MKTIFLYLLLTAALFIPACAESPGKNPQEALPMLGTLKTDAIEIGEGAKDAYVFIDPKCLKSRDFLETIKDNPTLRKTFHYYIFLYDMPQVSSETVINAVYSAPSPKEAVFTYMLDHKRLSKETGETPPQAIERINRIKKVAEMIGIDRTPYLIVDKRKQP